VCKKEGCWSTNHPENERKEAMNKLNTKFQQFCINVEGENHQKMARLMALILTKRKEWTTSLSPSSLRLLELRVLIGDDKNDTDLITKI